MSINESSGPGGGSGNPQLSRTVFIIDGVRVSSETYIIYEQLKRIADALERKD